MVSPLLIAIYINLTALQLNVFKIAKAVYTFAVKFDCCGSFKQLKIKKTALKLIFFLCEQPEMCGARIKEYILYKFANL